MGRPVPHDASAPSPATTYDTHLAAVYGLARQITGDDTVAASVTQEVFGTLRPLTPTPSDSLLGCLLIEAHRRSVRWVRKARTTGHAAPPLIPTAVGLATLPPEERDVIADAFFGGETYAEIARRRGLEPAAVARLLHRGLQRLSAAQDGAGHSGEALRSADGR